MPRLRKARILGFLLAGTLMISSCGTLFTKGGGDYRTGEKAYKAGNYVAAAEGAISALEANPDFEEAKDLLNRSFPKATEALEGGIEAVRSSSEQFPNETIAPLYEKLSGIHSRAGKLGLGLAVQDYSAELKTAQEAILEDRYQAAIAALEAGGYKNARLAERYLDFVRQRVSDYKDINYYLNQAWDASVAKLYIHTAGDVSNLGEYVSKALKENKQFNDVNKIVNPSLGLGSNASVAEVVSGAKSEGIDILFYIEGAISSDANPVSENDKELFTGFQGTTLTASYKATLSGNWQIIDVATGDVRFQDDFASSIGDKLYVEALKSTSKKSVEDVGTLSEKTVPVLEVPSFGTLFGKPMRAVIATAEFNEQRISEPKNYASGSMSGISKNLDGVWLFNNVYAIIDEEENMVTADYDNDAKTWDSIAAVVKKHTSIYKNIQDNVKKSMDGWIASAKKQIVPKAADTLYRATAAPLQK